MTWSYSFLTHQMRSFLGEMDGIMPDQDKVSGESQLEKKWYEFDTKISEDDGKDTEVDKNNKYEACSESGEQESIDNYESELEKTLPPKERGDMNSIVDCLYNQLDVDMDDYESESILIINSSMEYCSWRQCMLVRP